MSIADYIEFPDIDKPTLNWRDEINRTSSDWIIEVRDCEAHDTKQYRVHLRRLSKSSDFFFSVLTNAVESISASSSFEDCRFQGDISVKLEDGTELQFQLTETIRAMKRKIHELLKVPVRDQVLSPVRQTETMPLLSEDWRTLAEAKIGRAHVWTPVTL